MGPLLFLKCNEQVLRYLGSTTSLMGLPLSSATTSFCLFSEASLAILTRANAVLITSVMLWCDLCAIFCNSSATFSGRSMFSRRTATGILPPLPKRRYLCTSYVYDASIVQMESTHGRLAHERSKGNPQN